MNILNRAFGGSDDVMPMDAILQFVQSAWQRGNPHGRARLIDCIKNVGHGYRLSVSAPWKQVATAFKLWLVRRESQTQLADLLKRAFLDCHSAQVQYFHTALHPELRMHAELDATLPKDSPVHDLHSWCPTVSDFDAAHRTVTVELKARFVHFVAVVVLVGVETWRAPALSWLNSLLGGTCDATGKTDPQTGEPSDASTNQGHFIGGKAPDIHSVESHMASPSPDEASGEQTQEQDDEDSGDVNPMAGTMEDLGELDRILTDAIVASANQQHGAIALITAERVAHEFALMNLKRAQSFFHWGFALAFTGAPIPPHGKEFNPARRAWLVAGWLNGHARSSAHEAMTRLNLLDPTDHAVLKNHAPAASTIAPTLVSQFLKHELTESLIEWMPSLPPGSSPPPNEIRSVAGRLVREAHFDKLQRLANAVWNYRPAVAPGLALELQAMCGRCLRLVGKHDQSVEELNNFSEVLALINAASSKPESDTALFELLRSDVEAELMLAMARVSRVEDIWFNQRQTPEAVRLRFGGSVPIWLEKARLGLGNGRVSTDLAYLLALTQLCVTNTTGRHDTDHGCLECLDAALRAGTHESTEAEPTGMIPRLRLIHALLAARITEESAQCALAVEEIIDFESRNPCLPSQIIRPVVDAAILFDNRRVADLLAARAERDVESMLAVCDLADAVRYEGVRSVLFQRLSDVIENLPYSDGWKLRMQLFVGTVDAGVKDDSVKRLADDLVGVLMATQGNVDELIRVLLEKERWTSVWDSTGEFAGTLAHLACRSTDDALRHKAGSIIHTAFMHHVSEGGGRALAEDLIDALKELRMDDAWIREATDLLNDNSRRQPATPMKPAQQPPARRVRVLFIGGDERQKREEARTIELLSQSAPNAVPTFEYPGWSANWGPKLERARALIEKADVVVMMRFMRTEYGGHIRRLVNERGIQWRATVGHGCHAITRAMAEAAKLLG